VNQQKLSQMFPSATDQLIMVEPTVLPIPDVQLMEMGELGAYLFGVM
jgi:hypothetical protein